MADELEALKFNLSSGNKELEPLEFRIGAGASLNGLEFRIGEEGGVSEWDLYISANEHVLTYGSAFEKTLPAGTYELTPTGGACDDNVPGPHYWSWYLRTLRGSLGGIYSMANPFSEQADSEETAYNSVKGQKLIFSWPGGVFKMWIPADDQTDNNSGGLNINLKKVA
ncbi:MAG: hypothetical protein JW984_15285 [Deltaproteobacteria bacterium]|uniref:Uncharacterized protein n=1 Tax=Candidatus Zymogenus saltonus TaxID=2844893 RepID=A0A9D8KIP0_9DELT|nr:hypothetical protein [Candidatus Zymogenus saltonus]